MDTKKIWRASVTGILVFNLIASLLSPVAALAAEKDMHQPLPAISDSNNQTPIKQASAELLNIQSYPDLQANPAEDAPQASDLTALSVTILSTPWATLDHNGPDQPDTPHVFVIEAMVTNTGGETANNVIVTLDYQENQAANWVLLPGEIPARTIDSLAPGAVYYAYWFATYSSVIGAYHLYTVTASADNAGSISTSQNFYAPALDRTITTQTALSTGNSGLRSALADIVVGVAFTIDVVYALGTSPSQLIFSPVGNTDFNPGAYRLISTEVRFYNSSGNLDTVQDRLYFPTVNQSASHAAVKYTFLALTAANTRLCSYTVVKSGTNNKYDQFYCDEKSGTIIPIEGSVSLALVKQAKNTILQNQVLTYTIQYTNTGSVDLTSTWIWDDVASTLSIVTPSINPPSDPLETTDARVAWDLGNIPALGSGELSFSTLVDGNGQDLPDGSLLVNHAFFGINPGSLPSQFALTSVVTTTVHAPTVGITKTDGKISVEPDDESTYTLDVTNTGSVEAAGIIITDTLPVGVSLNGTPSLTPYTQNGQTLVWHYPGTLAAANGLLTITIPVKVGIRTPNGTVLSNQAKVEYQNTAGHKYQVKTATDITTVNGPVLTINKSDSPDPILTGNSLTYTIHYANTGPSEATNVVITDTVPVNTTFVSCDGGTSCSEAGGVVTWTLGTVPAVGQVNASGSVNFSVLVDSNLTTGTLITNNDYGIKSDQTNNLAGAPVTTTVNRDAAIFDGYTFIDANGNGKKDSGESGIPGISVTLPEATSSPQLTDPNGYYKFRVEQAVPVSITAAEKTGYFRTTPGTINVQSTLGITQTVNFGYAPDDATFGVVYGLVFKDNNHNSILNSGELGISGVTITSAQAVTSTTSTDTFGAYTLRFDVAEETTVTVNETNPANYISTTPDSVQTQVHTASSGSSPVNFGDFMGIKITGQVFDDVNVNGIKDAGESGLAGATVSANGEIYLTDGTGMYSLYTVPTGVAIDIIESNPTSPTSYISTNAIPGNGMLRLNPDTLRISTPVAGQIYSGGDFGDVASTGVVTIQGLVWNDNGAGSNLANGQRDAGEPGLAGAEVSLSTGLSQLTGSDGAFLLYAPPGEVITITEANPSAYVSTNAIPGNGASKWDNDTLVLAPQIAAMTSSGNLFGDVQSSSAAILQGTVFDDLNMNGLLDTGETGLPNVLLTLEIYLSTTTTVRTDVEGQYQFAVPPGKDVRITSSGPGGSYHPTTPESLVVRPPSPGIYAGNDYGYSEETATSVIIGIVFDDWNSNGEVDFGEYGLAGATVTVGNISIQTTGNGLITGTFTIPITPTVDTIYHVQEQNPAGYRSTTPDQLYVKANPGHSYLVEFGDTNSINISSIYGTSFDDLDLDGMQDLNEVGLPGVVISITVGGPSNVITATTKPYGQFSYGFDISEAGFHTVSEQDPAKPGYRSTTPDYVNINVQMGQSYVVDFGNAPDTFSVIQGTVFNDSSGEGIIDPSEEGIPGVTVTLDGVTWVTDTLGRYFFTIPNSNLPDTVQVSEQDLTDYHSTTPNLVPLNVQPSMTYQVNFGDSNDTTVASIYGTVFNDLDVDGLYDLEPGLAGVSVNLLNGTTAHYLTNQWGQYTFQVGATGIYTITETDPAGYVSTNAIPGSPYVTKIDANTLVAQVNSMGTSLGANNFGDVLRSSVVAISGLVWNDNGSGGGVAGDGQQNGTEPGLAGATVAVETGMAQVTGAAGTFELYSLNRATTLTETNPGGYVSTNAIPGTNASRENEDTIFINIPSGQSSSINNKFGDVGTAQFAVITGKVYDDQDEDGLVDALEPVFSGRTVTMDIVGGGTLAKQTDANGNYLFAVLPGTELRITSTNPGAGYYSTTSPNLYLKPPTAGLYPNNDFGYSNDTDSAVIYGTVFKDNDQDTLWDLNEPSIPGVSITLDNNPPHLTDVNGNYFFRITTVGNHTVVEADLGGYQSTTPNRVTTAVELGQGYQINFGDVALCTIGPDSYEEDDSYTQSNLIQIGVSQKQSHNFADDPNDWVKFTAQAGMVYTVTTSATGFRADTYIELFDTDGQKLLKANDDFTADFSSQLVWKADKDGVYYIKVTNRDNLTFCLTEYDLWVEEAGTSIQKIYLPIIANGTQATASSLKSPASPLGIMNHEFPDAFEVDDTWLDAQPILPVVSQVHSFDSNPVLFLADKDWVHVDLQFMDDITFTTQPVTNTQTLLELYDENGYALNVKGINQLNWKATEDGRYYLSISPDPDSSLNVNFGPSVDVGYVLTMFIKPVNLIYLPFLRK